MPVPHEPRDPGCKLAPGIELRLPEAAVLGRTIVLRDIVITRDRSRLRGIVLCHAAVDQRVTATITPSPRSWDDAPFEVTAHRIASTATGFERHEFDVPVSRLHGVVDSFITVQLSANGWDAAEARVEFVACETSPPKQGQTAHARVTLRPQPPRPQSPAWRPTHFGSQPIKFPAASSESIINRSLLAYQLAAAEQSLADLRKLNAQHIATMEHKFFVMGAELLGVTRSRRDNEYVAAASTLLICAESHLCASGTSCASRTSGSKLS